MKLLLALLLVAAVPSAARAADDVTLFRIFLTDGSEVVCYGEYVRAGGQVILALPAGGPVDRPRLHMVTLPDIVVDWPRTERYAASARYQRYADTRGEEDFQRLTNEVARVLNEIALTTDRQRALSIAQEARRRLAEWPQAHYGYRQQDVREVVGMIDESINSLAAASGAGSFELSLVAFETPIELEPVAGMPRPYDQLYQLLRLSARPNQPASERVALLQSALALLNDAGSGIVPADAAVWRNFAESQIRDEAAIDQKYARMVRDVTEAAARGVARASVSDVEGVLRRIAKEDERLGQKRSEVVQALRATVDAQLEAARRLRLLRDQWMVRRATYREYQRTVGSQMRELARVEPLLQAIRKLEGPPPNRLSQLRTRLSGGAERLQRLRITESLQTTHDLLVSAWRFAEHAVNARFTAIASGNVTTAWEASSAAAAALMMLGRAQQELRSLIEPPAPQ